ncbi:MAG: TlpA disulfide reductase family protein, partial [Dehalococcoidia bacterium]
AIVFAYDLTTRLEEGSFEDFNPFTGVLVSGPAPVLGETAPDFELPLLDGGTFKLSDHRGQVVWINFWATWCQPCRAEMPDIEKVWQEEQGSDLVLIAVDFGESKKTVEGFVQKLGLTFPIGMDSRGKITTNYRVSGFPSHFMVDREGILRDIRVGLMTEANMREKLERLRSY